MSSTPPVSSEATRPNTVPAQRGIYLPNTRTTPPQSPFTSTLATALLASIGETNVVLLKTTYPTVKTYALTPRQIVDTMIAKHGIPTSDDVSKLREPLSRALTS
jgi:hypothetical protein